MKRPLFALISLLLTVAGYAQTVNLSSTNLPILVINTGGQSIPQENKITADLGIIFNAGNARNNITDPFNHYNGKIGIEVRGQSSTMFPMKSYGIELRDAAGLSQDVALFGMPAESDWVLYAPYTDKTLMRNVLAYQLSRELGHWAARTKFVELILDGDYKGVYVFEEKIKRGSGRVNIAKLKTTDVTGDDVTGGYIFSVDKQPNAWFSKYPTPNSTNGGKRQFSYVYPKIADIQPAQAAYIRSAVDAFEDALASSDFQNPFTGVRRYADLNSFIDYFIVNEISRNVDGYRLSTYLHKDKDSKNPRIFAGPVWDYDLAFRNADYCEGSNPAGWAYQFNYVCPGDGAGLVPFWWDRLMMDTAFSAALRCRWKTLSTTTLSIDHFTKVIDSITSVLSEASVRHHQRWNILGKYVWPNPSPIATSYAQEIDYLKQWLGARLGWIGNNLPNTGGCYDFPVDYKASVIIRIISNPVSSASYIDVRSRYTQQLEMEVFDMMGRKMGVRRMAINAGQNNIPLYAGSWAAGVYLVRFTTTNGERISIRVVK